MLEQRVEGPSLKGWRGVALILAVALLVVGASHFFSFLSRWIGGAASPMFIAFGCAVALFLLEGFVMRFEYLCGGGCLRVARRYGRYRRPVAEVWLNSIQACGDLDAMRRRFPAARVQRAVRRECPLAPLAVAYNDGGKTTILLLQPDDAIRQRIVRAVKK